MAYYQSLKNSNRDESRGEESTIDVEKNEGRRN